MRIETHHGNKIVCGHIFPVDEIKPGQRWQGSSGHIVTVTNIDQFKDVTYIWHESGETKEHSKDFFSFQCRYCLIVGAA